MSLCPGSSALDAANYAVAIEKNVVFDGLTFGRAFALWFTAFFVFNMEYPTDAYATLEFIQRYCHYNNVDEYSTIQQIFVGLTL